MKQRILITGVAGLIGSHLLRRLLEQGHEVVGVDDLSLGRLANIEAFVEDHRFEFHQESILNFARMDRLCSGIQTVFHFAALKIPRYKGYLRTLEVNCRGTESMLEAARKNGAHVIFASTDDVYGKNPESSLTEESMLVLGESRISRWGAAASKVYGEHLCFGYAEKYHVPISIIRYSGVYGSTFQLSNLSGAQDLFIIAALTDRPIPIHGDGAQTRPFTHISDAINATLKVFETPYAEGEVINVGSDSQISIINLAYLIWRLTGAKKKPELQFIPYTDFSRLYEDPRQRRVDISKSGYLLGYCPTIGLEEGMRGQVEWFRSNLAKVMELNPDSKLDKKEQTA